MPLTEVHLLTIKEVGFHCQNAGFVVVFLELAVFLCSYAVSWGSSVLVGQLPSFNSADGFKW